MRAACLAVSVLWLAACSDPPTHTISSLPQSEPTPSETTPSETTPSEPAPSVPAPTEPAPSAPPRGAPPVSAETMATVQRLVREARTLEHDGDHRGALARFDEALRLVPTQPRILCEAGFIAHRAGETALAARRIDTALAVFGPPRDVPAPLRVPLAMCLYNRGLVAEAESEPGEAVEAFEASLSLRPNATVEASLVRARAALAVLPAPDDEVSHVGGVPMDGSAYAIATTDVEAYERALRAGMRGTDWDGSYREPSTTVIARQPVATDGHPAVLVHTVVTADAPLALSRLVVSWPLDRGYQAQDLELGHVGNEDDGTEQAVSVLEVSSSWHGELLQIDVRTESRSWFRLYYTGEDDEPCGEETAEEVQRSWTLLCRDVEDDRPYCVALPTLVQSTGRRTTSFCDDEAVSAEEGPPVLARAIVTVTDTGVMVSQVRDDAALLPLDGGPLPWDDVFALDNPMMLTEWVSDEEVEDAGAL